MRLKTLQVREQIHFDVQKFAIGARKELAKQKPDKESYVEAAVVAKKAKGR
jgi:hypothetical protein